MTFAIDFDGTITTNTAMLAKDLTLKPGVKELLRGLKAAGHRLILHSCRFGRGLQEIQELGYDRWTEEGRKFLEAHDLLSLFDEIWEKSGKPFADFYLDDRAMTIEDFVIWGRADKALFSPSKSTQPSPSSPSREAA